MNLPERTRPRLSPIFRDRVGPELARLLSAAAWRALHPGARGRFVEAPRPVATRRLYYRACDGWRAPLFCIEPKPGAPGEPVVVVHGLLGGPDLYRYGADTPVATLREAGFAVYLLAYRGDRHPIPPVGRRDDADLEAIVERDLPAALTAVAEHSGFARVHVLGHGFGGLVALALAGHRHPALATVVALAAPVGGTGSLPAPGLGTAALRWLPGSWSLPLGVLARWEAILVPEEPAFALARDCVPSRLRGALLFTAGDAPVRLVRAMRGWLAHGADLYEGAVELGARLADAEVPLLVVTALEDPICPREAGEAALPVWGHPDRTAVRAPGSHLDLVLGAGRPSGCSPPSRPGCRRGGGCRGRPPERQFGGPVPRRRYP